MEELENYIRLDLLIKGVAQDAARFLFDQEFSPVRLGKSIKAEITKLTELKEKHHYITKPQWKLLFPKIGDPDSKTFDINLITTLLRNLTDLHIPKKGFDELPSEDEVSPASDLARLKFYRNHLAHIDNRKIDNDKFNKAWGDISGAIQRLGTQDMVKEGEILRSQNLNQSIVPSNDNVCSNIKEWHLSENPINTETNMKKLQDCMEIKQIVILKGLIGTGKSELALRYCYSARKVPVEHTGIVYKLRCTDVSMFAISLHELCNNLQDNEHFESRKEESKEDAVCRITDVIVKELGSKAQQNHILFLDDVKQKAKHIVSNFIKTCKRVKNIKIIVTTSLSLDTDKESEVIEIRGFSEDESVEFLNNGNDCQETDINHYVELARKFNFNPMGLQIARTYMARTVLTVKDLVKQLNRPADLLEFEESMTVKDQISDKTLFRSLIRLVEDMHEKYKKEGKEHIFEMLLSLQFLEVETIPVELFTKFDSEISFFNINDLLYEIKNCSFGSIDERNSSFSSSEKITEQRNISTHDVVRLALQLYMTIDKQGINHSTNEKVLRKLLRAFYLLMDKDNKNSLDLRRHNLLLPHARSVINHLKNNTTCGKDATNFLSRVGTFTFQLESKIHIIYLKDLIGYTYSFSEMFNEAVLYYDEAKSDILELLGVNDKHFHADLVDLMKLSFDELTVRFKQKASELFIAANEFIHKNLVVLKIVSKDYVLNRYRNANDVKILESVLENHKLEKATHLVQDEYDELLSKGYAVQEEMIGSEFLFGLLISILHTFGRRLFYQPDDIDWSSGTAFFPYLVISSKLSKMTYWNDNQVHTEESIEHCTHNKIREHVKFNRLYSWLTERSEMQAVFIFLCKWKTVEAITLKGFICTCKERFNEETDYLEFGILKVLGTNDSHAKTLYAKMIARCYISLLKIEDTEEIRLEAKKSIENMRIPNRGKHGLVYSIGELYFTIGDFIAAEKCFRDLLPTFEVEVKDVKRHLKISNRRACVSYIKCRVKRSGQEEPCFITETLQKLKCFKNVLRHYKKEIKELEEIEMKLQHTF